MKVNNINHNIYQKTALFIKNSPKTQKLLQNIEANTSLYSGILAFTVGSTIKPLTILAIKNDKEDNIFAVSRSISTSIADVGLAIGIFIPLKKALDIQTKRLFNTKNSIYYQNRDACSRFKSVYNRIAKIALIPLFAFSKFALIPNIAKYLKKIGIYKNDKKDSIEQKFSEIHVKNRQQRLLQQIKSQSTTN